MQVVQVDDVGLQAVQTGITGRSNAFGTAVDANDRLPVATGPRYKPCLGRQRVFVTPLLQNPTQQRLVMSVAIAIGRVEQAHAVIECVVQSGFGLRLVGGTVCADIPQQPIPTAETQVPVCPSRR